MKAKVKKTGEIIEVEPLGILNYYAVKDSKTFEKYPGCDLDFDYYKPTYWERLEHTYAGMAMQGMMAHTNIDHDEIVDLCIEFAHSLVEKLKEKEERK